MNGIDTNQELQYLILHTGEYVKGNFDTSFIENNLDKLVGNKWKNYLKSEKEKLNLFKFIRNKLQDKKRIDVPDGLYTKCDTCGESILSEDLKENYYVCPACGAHLKMRAYTRLNLLYDGGKYKELYQYIKSNDPLMFPGYKDKLAKLKQTTGLDEAVVCATGKIDGRKVVVCVMDARFLVGSMSGAVGEKITRAIEHATKRKTPLIIFTTSGGARMQEGIISLMQMGKN